MAGTDIFELILIIAALVCFLIEFVKSGFSSLLALGLACLAGYFLVVAISSLGS